MPAVQSPFFGINYGWVTGEDGWGDPVNLNFKVLSFLDRGSVDSFVSSLPGSPVDGSSYVLTTDSQIYVRYPSEWLFITPQEGQVIRNNATSTTYAYLSGVWTDITSVNLTTFNSAIKNSLLKVVNTIADLKALSVNTYNFAVVLGYYAAGDGGGGVYRSTTDIVSADNGGSIIVATDNTRWKLNQYDTINVKQFGATGDGTTNDQPFIQAAINSAPAQGAKIILPPGNYRLNSGLAWTNSYISLFGSGIGTTVLTCNFASGDIIKIGTNVTNPNNCEVGKFSITSLVTRTSGAAICFQNGHGLRARDFRLDSNMYVGVQLLGGPQQFLYYVDEYEINSGNTGIAIGDAATGLVQDVTIRQGICANCTFAGYLFKNVSGLYGGDFTSLGCGKGYLISPAASEWVKAVHLANVIADTCNDQGWHFVTTSTGKVVNFKVTNLWAASNGVLTNAAGVHFEGPSIDGVSLVSPISHNNKGHGIFLAGGVNIDITSPQCFSNSQASSATYHGISVAAGVSKWSVVGGVSGAGGEFTGNIQGYGILINSGASTDYRIIGTNVTGNVTGGISDGGTGTTKYIIATPGARTANSGNGVITSGTSSAVVTHNLNFTPGQQDVRITPTTSPASSNIGSMWVSAATATTFTVTSANTTVADQFFGWSVNTKGNY